MRPWTAGGGIKDVATGFGDESICARRTGFAGRGYPVSEFRRSFDIGSVAVVFDELLFVCPDAILQVTDISPLFLYSRRLAVLLTLGSVAVRSIPAYFTSANNASIFSAGGGSPLRSSWARFCCHDDLTAE